MVELLLIKSLLKLREREYSQTQLFCCYNYLHKYSVALSCRAHIHMTHTLSHTHTQQLIVQRVLCSCHIQVNYQVHEYCMKHRHQYNSITNFTVPKQAIPLFMAAFAFAKTWNYHRNTFSIFKFCIILTFWMYDNACTQTHAAVCIHTNGLWLNFRNNYPQFQSTERCNEKPLWQFE